MLLSLTEFPIALRTIASCRARQAFQIIPFFERAQSLLRA